MPEVDFLREAYFIREFDSDFASGRRADLVYAVPSRTLSYTHLNPGGPEPLTYLQYARRDIASGTQQGAINALASSKRAVHLSVDKLMQTYSLDAWLKEPFPVKAGLLQEVGALPTRMVSALNRARNMVEHNYKYVELEQAADFVELTELVLTVAYPFFRQATIAAFVGVVGANECVEWYIEPGSQEVAVFQVVAESYIDLPVGRVHYNMEPSVGQPHTTVPITETHRLEWIKFLDVLVYCTRQRTLRLRPPDPRGPGTYISLSHNKYVDHERKDGPGRPS